LPKLGTVSTGHYDARSSTAERQASSETTRQPKLTERNELERRRLQTFSRQAFLRDQDPELTFVTQAILMGIATAAAFRSGSELTGCDQR
jgi:hypothetical protein